LQLAAVADVQGELDAIWASVPWARTNEFAPEP
jgi:hypothetical protein